ncbi:hypothetical protein MTO96_040503 [Rhipicephalus appendiculatus]
MERLVKKRKVIRAQITRLINDYESRPGPLDGNEAAILHARFTSWHNDLNIVNKDIEPLVTDEDAENEFQQTCDYQDRIVACLARLQRQMTVQSRPTNAESAAHICGLESLGRKLHTYGAMLLPVVQRAMPRDILLDFGRKCATDANSTFDDQRSSSSEGPEPTTPEGDREIIGRRGIPSTIYIDNAPTFKNDNKDLASLW